MTPVSSSAGSGRRAGPGKRACPGFTLIELLVVIVIIATMVTVAVISINALGRDTEIKDETERLEALIGLAREQGEMQGRDYGLRLEGDSYQFLAYDPRREQWTELPDDELLHPRTLPAGLRFRLVVESREVVLKPPADLKAPRPPQIMLFSSGDMTAFDLTLQREDSDHQARFIGQADGTLEVHGVDEQRQ